MLCPDEPAQASPIAHSLLKLHTFLQSVSVTVCLSHKNKAYHLYCHGGQHHATDLIPFQPGRPCLACQPLKQPCCPVKQAMQLMPAPLLRACHWLSMRRGAAAAAISSEAICAERQQGACQLHPQALALCRRFGVCVHHGQQRCQNGQTKPDCCLCCLWAACTGVVSMTFSSSAAS